MKKLTQGLLLLLCLMMLSPALGEAKPDSYQKYLGERARMLKAHGPYSAWTIEQKAALDAPYDKEPWMTGSNRMISRLPGKDDLSQEEATDKAIAALTGAYDLREEELSQWEKEYDFWELASGKSWIIIFKSPQAEPGDGYKAYRVEVESPGGKAEYHDVEERSGLYTPSEDKKPPEVPADILEKAKQAALETDWAREKGLTRDILEGFQVLPALMPIGQLRDFSNAHIPKDLDDKKMAWLIDFMSDDPVLNEHFITIEVAFLEEDGQQLMMDPAVNG